METPKEKAIQLFDKYYSVIDEISFSENQAIECSQIAVDEILNANAIWYKDSIPYNYWHKVKQELNKL